MHSSKSLASGLALLATAARADSSACKLAAIPSVDLSAGFIDKANYDCAPSTGTLNGLLLFVDFSDEPATETAKEMEAMFLPGTNDWYETASYGKLALNMTADSRFIRMPKTAAAYGFTRGISYQEHLDYIMDAFNAWQDKTNAQPPSGQEPLTDVLYVISTNNAKSIATSATLATPVRDANTNRLIAHRAVTLGPDDPAVWEKVLEHETGHTLCLPDMYPLTGGDPATWVGNWDLMATLQGQSQDFFAWNKWRLGWLGDNQIECVAAAGSSTHKLTPLETEGGVKAVVVKQSETEALVAEVRSKNGVDSDMCAPGVLLYTVSTEIPTGEGPFKVQDANPGGPGNCGYHEFDNAPLSLEGGGAKSLKVAEFGVTVTVTEQNGDNYTIRVDKS